MTTKHLNCVLVRGVLSVCLCLSSHSSPSHNPISIFDTLLADYMPKGTLIYRVLLLALTTKLVYFNFKQHQISPSYYLPYAHMFASTNYGYALTYHSSHWLVPGFVDHLPFEACARIWDVLVLEGDSFLYRTAIAVLGVIESRLFFPDRQELLDILE